MGQAAGKYMDKILVLNGMGDALFVLPAVQAIVLDKAYSPLLNSLGKDHFAASHIKQVWGFTFLGLGCLRILAGLNYSQKLARQVAILSYLAECVPAMYFLLTASSEHVDNKHFSVMAFLPLLAIAVIAQHKDNSANKSQ